MEFARKKILDYSYMLPQERFNFNMEKAKIKLKR